ncbi:hypothetical protein ACIP10_15405 [Streptomyces galbus]|uniref:hypothetical protein n=1 Tax=Streptomyces galbus TaxID=33898 RepID=UPI00378C624C
MNTRTTACATLLALAAALTACSTGDSADSAVRSTTPKPAATHTPDPGYSDAMKAAGIPPEPTGHDRAALLNALAAVNPAIVTHEQRAIDGARNQCSSINRGAQNLDQSAAQRFTYKDVITTQAQGKRINQALKDSGFCKV